MPPKLPKSLLVLLAKLKQAITDIFDRFEEGELTAVKWRDAMKSVLTRFITASFMSGQESPLIGVTEQGYIYEYVKAQLGFIDNFYLSIVSSDEFKVGWRQRAESYANSIVAPFWKGETKMVALPAMPGDMTTPCGQLCACLWDVQAIDEEKGDYDAYWRLNASREIETEHCQICEQRSKEWAPLKIRNNMLVIPPGEAGKEFVEHILETFKGHFVTLEDDRVIYIGDPKTSDSMLASARYYAKKLGYDQNKIRISYNDKKMKIGDVEMSYAGSYDPYTGEITIYPKDKIWSDKSIQGIIAHEVAHDTYNEFEKQWDKESMEIENLVQTSNIGIDEIIYPDGRLKEKYLDKYPAYGLANELAYKQKEITEKDGITGYSTLYWNAYKEGKGSISRAIDETLAESNYYKITGRNHSNLDYWLAIREKMKRVI